MFGLTNRALLLGALALVVVVASFGFLAGRIVGQREDVASSSSQQLGAAQDARTAVVDQPTATTFNAAPVATSVDIAPIPDVHPSPSLAAAIPEKQRLQFLVDRAMMRDSREFGAAIRSSLEERERLGTLDLDGTRMVSEALATVVPQVPLDVGSVRCSRSICEIALAKSTNAVADPRGLRHLMLDALARGSGFGPQVMVQMGEGFDPDRWVYFAFNAQATDFVASFR